MRRVHRVTHLVPRLPDRGHVHEGASIGGSGPSCVDAAWRLNRVVQGAKRGLGAVRVVAHRRAHLWLRQPVVQLVLVGDHPIEELLLRIVHGHLRRLHRRHQDTPLDAVAMNTLLRHHAVGLRDDGGGQVHLEVKVTVSLDCACPLLHRQL